MQDNYLSSTHLNQLENVHDKFCELTEEYLAKTNNTTEKDQKRYEAASETLMEIWTTTQPNHKIPVKQAIYNIRTAYYHITDLRKSLKDERYYEPLTEIITNLRELAKEIINETPESKIDSPDQLKDEFNTTRQNDFYHSGRI